MSARIRLLSFTALGALAVAGFSPAFAQAPSAPVAPETQSVDAVIVAGERQLSRDPQSAKKSTLAVQDSLGALQIQQLTDATVADVISRVPGISIQRGFQTQKGWYATIRGLEGNYNSVDLDGGMFIDSTRNDRAAYLDTVPAAAINELVVTKTVTSDMDPNSIGGHVSIRTLRSFDLGGAPLIRGDLQLNKYSEDGARETQKPGLTGNVVVKRVFGPDENFGFVLAASAHDDRRSEVFNNATTYAFPNSVAVPSGPLQHGNFDLHDHGYSFLGKLDARSGDRFYGFAAFNFFKLDMLQDNYRGGLAINSALVTNVAIGSGTFTGATAQAISRRYEINRQVATLTTGFDYQPSDLSKISVVASYGKSDHNEEVFGGSPFTFGGLNGNYVLGENEAVLTLAANPNLAVASNWRVNPATASVNTHLPMTDKVMTFRADFNQNTFSFSRGFGFAGGVSVRRLNRVFVQSADNYTLPTGAVYSLDQALVTNGAPSVLNGSGVVYVDFERFWSYVRANGTNNRTTTPSSSYDLIEDAAGAYLLGQYATDKLKIQAGLRYEYTTFDNKTATLQGTNPVPLSFSRNYGYLLPNVQASYDWTDQVRLRVAYTETIARPTFTTFAQGLTINNFSSSTPFIRGSNPDLEARKSDNLDAAIDWYLPGGYLSLAVFDKQISNEVYFQTTNTTNAATGVTTQIVTPRNAGQSSLRGVELSGAWSDFTRLSPWLGGVEVRANYTWLDGELGLVNSDGTKRAIASLAQQPQYIANLILVYDRDQFAGSLIYSARGRALGGGLGASAAGDLYIDPYDSLNLRVGYRPTDHIELFVAGDNITGNWFREKTGINRDQHLTAIQDGTTVKLGVQFRF